MLCPTSYPTWVVKTSLYLPEDLKRRVRLAARERGVSEAQFVREALAAAAPEPEAPPMPVFPAFRGEGPLRDDASRVDELLEETGFGEW